MILWLLLFTISSFVAIPAGFNEGLKGGIIGAIIGLIVGLAVGIGWFAGLLAVKARVLRCINLIKVEFWSVAAVVFFYLMVLASSVGSYYIASRITRSLVHLVTG